MVSPDQSFDQFGLDCKELLGAKADQGALEWMQLSWLRQRQLWHWQPGDTERRSVTTSLYR
ncbi:MAG: hypothetical protein FalmKO_35480 [Falsiruegeria mediterranea]